jgi:hypothetical protein
MTRSILKAARSTRARRRVCLVLTFPSRLPPAEFWRRFRALWRAQ